MTSKFVERLFLSSASNHSLVCVGLDPDPNLMPVNDILEFNKSIVDATKDLVCAYKPNIAFYEALGFDGLVSLEKTISYIRNVAPGVVIVGDMKRGDVENSALAYAKAAFEVWGFDAVTVNPYGGLDSVQPFLRYANNGVFLWCRSSSTSNKDFQNLELSPGTNTKFIYQWVASEAIKWNENQNIGLVVGSTHPSELHNIRVLCPDLPLLIPAIGAQGGDINKSVRYGVDGNWRGAIFNSSRSILYASSGNDFAEAAREATLKLQISINNILNSGGHGW